MNFLGVDLSKVPKSDLQDIKTLIIPILYVISSFVSIRLSTNMQNKMKEEKTAKTESVQDDENNENDNNEAKEDTYDAMNDANKTMNWLMPIMSISIACIAPLGLALYWLANNVLMIIERLILNKFLKDEEEKEEIEKNA